MKISFTFDCPSLSSTLVRLPASNSTFSSSRKPGGLCPGNSEPEQPRTLIFNTTSDLFRNYSIDCKGKGEGKGIGKEDKEKNSTSTSASAFSTFPSTSALTIPLPVSNVILKIVSVYI